MPVRRIPKNFQTTGGNLVNFDTAEVITGTGLIILYAGVGGSTTTGSYLLSQSQFYSQELHTGASGSETSLTLEMDIDFDITFERPLNIEGESVISVPVATRNRGGSKSDFRVDVTVYKVSGGTETAIQSTIQSDLFSNTSDNVRKFHMLSFKVDLSRIHFNKNDILRLNVQGYGAKGGGGTDYNLWIGHDPQNRDTITTIGESAVDWSGNPTNLLFPVPFRI